MTFPNTPIIDNFNRSNGSLGANWNSIHSIVSNAVSVNANSGNSVNSLYTASAYSANAEGYLTLTTLDGEIRVSIILNKLTTVVSNNDDMIVALYDDAQDRIEAYYWNGSSFNVPSISSGDRTVSFSNGDVLGAALVSGILNVYKNSTFIVAFDCTGFTNLAGGYIGFRTSTTQSTVVVDDFGGGNISTGPVIPVFMNNYKQRRT